MAVAIQLIELADGRPSLLAGQFLMAADVDREIEQWTGDIASALQFTDVGDALEFWRQPSRARPVRPDGRPNRPLTAYTVALVPVKEPPP
jgi:hypothetical protein